jgi:hypothetical protein
MFKFINSKDNAPSFHSASFDFDQDVDYDTKFGLTTHVNLALTNDNIPVVFLNSFGLSYQHTDKFSISITEGTISQHKTTHNKNDDSQSDFIYLRSDAGKIKITDSFKSLVISWQKDDQRVQITTSDNNSVIIDYNTGVIDPNIQQYVNFMLDIFQDAPDMVKTSLWKKISEIQKRFGLISQ